MNQKVKSLLFVGLCISFMFTIITPIHAYGGTGLKTGNKLIYEVSLVRTQNWTLEARWYNLTHPAVPHYTNYTESRARILAGTITVDILEVRTWIVDMAITYDLRDYEYYYNKYLNDSNIGNDYTGSINQTLFPNGPDVVLDIVYTSFSNQSDSFEMEVTKLTRDISSMTKYDSSVPLTSAFYTDVSSGNDYCSFWIYPDAKSGEFYQFMHVGMILELIGDYESPNFGDSGNLAYEIEGSMTYNAPAGGKGNTQKVWIARYEPASSALSPGLSYHAFTVDLDNYRNEFLFDQSSGVLLQYRRSYVLEPFAVIRQSSSPNTEISATLDPFNTEFTMTLQKGSKVSLGISLLAAILMWIFIPAGIIAVVVILLRRQRT